MAIKRIGNRPKKTLSAEQKIAFALLLFLGVGGIYFGFKSFGANMYRPIHQQIAELYAGGTYVTAEERESKELEESKTKDTDGDGLVDYDEIYIYRTSPYLQDSDSDGHDDQTEVFSGNDPNCPEGRSCGVIAASTDEEANTSGVSVEGLTGADVSDDLSDIDLNDPEDVQKLFQSMTNEQLRATLISAGMSEEELAQIDDETLNEFFNETINNAALEEEHQFLHESEEEHEHDEEGDLLVE